MKKFAIYATKWQLGIIVVAPCMWFFHDKLSLNYVISTFLMQLIGAVVFYPIDNYIFRKTNKK